MKNQTLLLSGRTAIAVLGLLLLAGRPAQADLSVATGFDYSSGGYGSGEKTRITYVPFTLKYEAGRYFVRLTVPYLSIDAPVGGNIIAIGPDGQPIRASTGRRETQTGMGDVVTALGYTLLDTGAGRLLDVVGKIKFGTADEAKGLGTGKNDYSVQLDWSEKWDRFTLITTGGYRVYGDPPGSAFDNVWFASVGGVFKLAPMTSGGLIYDFRQNIVAGTDSQRDLTAFVTHKIGKSAKIQGYVSAGLSDASPDWGMGLIATFIF